MSGTVDTSIARSFQSPTGPVANPLQQFGQIVGVANALATNRRENETFNAQQQIGAALQRSMNPQTGEVDHNAFRTAIADNPLAAFLAPQALAQARALQQGTLQVEQAQAALGMQRLANLRQSLQGLLTQPEVTRQQVNEAVFHLLTLPESERPFSPAVAASQLATLPNDPAGIRNWLLTRMASTDAGLQQLQRFLPQPTPIQTGAATQFVDINPLTNPGASTQALDNQPTPQDRNMLVPRYNPNTRQMETVPRQEAGPMVGGTGRAAPGTVPGAGTPPAGPAQMPGGRPIDLGTGRFPGGPQGGAAGGRGVGQVPGAISPPGQPPQTSAIPAAPPLGQPEAAAITARQSGEAANSLAQQADMVPTTMATLQNMQTMLRQFNTGPGAAWTREMVNAYNRVAPPTMQIRVEGTAAQEEFVKLSTQLAQQQFQALGGTGANEQLASAMRTSPNETLSRMGNEAIISLLRGNADAIRVKNEEWQRWLASGNGPETFQQFSTQFNRNFDPRTFQAIYMSDSSRRQMMNSMNESERAAFTRSFRYALDRGWVRLPEGAR